MVKTTRRNSLNRTKFLSDDEYDHLETFLRRRLGGVETRDVLLILVAMKTGARAQELLNICRNDFSHKDQTLYIRGIKGSNDREIPIPDWLAIALASYLKHCPAAANIFPIGYFRLRQIWNLYRPVPKTLHCLRHSFAIRTYLKTKDVRLLQVALGHRSILNTMIYVDYAYSTQEMRRIL